jgi:hypothetical protein
MHRVRRVDACQGAHDAAAAVRAVRGRALRVPHYCRLGRAKIGFRQGTAPIPTG